MAKMDKHDRRHYSNLSAYARQIEAVYLSAVKEAAAIGALITDFNPDRLFSFSDYPVTRKRIDSLLQSLKDGLQAVIVNGVRSEWTLANNKNDEICKQVFGRAFGHLTKAQERRYLSTNDRARDAFLQRKTAGLRLSDRVWNYTNQFKEEIELGLDVGIRSGLSADEISRDLRMYLKYPDKLFRRVRDEHGNLQLSRNAAAFHPGQGVYRSSYKNARRLAVTETNIAYRTADHLRWQQMDFVVGIEIEPSDTNHPVRDICDDLKGKYPKDFKWTGWHPHCRCHATPILKTEDEVAEDNNRIIRGEEVSPDSVNTVGGLPSNFTEWVQDNFDRFGKGSVPYFITDNGKYVETIIENVADNDLKMKMISGWSAFGKSAQAKTGESKDELSDWVESLYDADDATSQIFRHRYVQEDWDMLVDDFLSTKMTQKEMDAEGDDDPIEQYILNNGKKATIPVYNLRPTQPWIGEPMQWVPWNDSKQKYPIPLIHIAGTDRYYVANGHHRAIQRILWGHDTVDAYVIEAPNRLIKKLSADDMYDKIAMKNAIKVARSKPKK